MYYKEIHHFVIILNILWRNVSLCDDYEYIMKKCIKLWILWMY